MTGRFDLVGQRLAQHFGHRAERSFETPADVVRSFGAVQAQDYLGALWAIGVRLPGARESDIEQALADKHIVRTWPMRGTLHFVAAADARWMLDLLAPPVIARSARRFAELELREVDFKRSRAAVVRALEGGRARTRGGMYEVLEKARISPAGQRGIHILGRLAQEGIICFGKREGRQQTFVLLEEWLPPIRNVARDEALAEVAYRYFAGHGPASLADFTWWSGLPAARAREGLEASKSRLECEVLEGRTYWFARATRAVRRSRPGGSHILPAFDEYLVGYRDRRAVLDHARAVNAGGGTLAPTVLVDGHVVGTWRRTLEGATVALALTPFEPMKAAVAKSVDRAGRAYAAFVGRTASISVAPALT